MNYDLKATRIREQDEISEIIREACCEYDLKTIKHLFKDPTEINIVYIRDEEGFTPLHYACQFGFMNAVKLLVENGADINAKSNEPTEPFFRAAITPLFMAVANNKKYIATYLIERGADVNLGTEVDPNTSNSALLNSIYYTRKDIIKILLDNGADINQLSRHSYGVLTESPNHSPDLCRLLMEYGFDINSKDSFKSTLLHYAAHHDNVPLAVFLIDSDIDIDSKDADNKTALQIVLEKGPWHLAEFAELLREVGAEEE